MKSVLITGYGARDRLELREIDRPVPAETDVLLRVKASSVNPLDWKLRSGKMRFLWPLKFPFTPGFDVAGIVEAVGSGVTRFQPGDSVFAGLTNGGAHAEYAAVEQSLCVAKPESLSFEEAAAIPAAGQSALQALRDVAGAGPGDQLLLNGASGGVGSFAVQIAAVLGCKVTGVTSTRNLDFVRSLGAENVLDYTHDDLFGLQPYDVFFDVVPNRSFRRCSHALSPEGVYVTTLPGPGPLFWKLFSKAGRVFGYRKRCGWLIVKPNGQDLQFLKNLVDEDKLRPVIESTYPLDQIREAHAESEQGHTRGKIVIRIE